MARKKDSPRAKAWDKLSGRGADETIATRDVYEAQQLDRSKIQKKQSRTSRTVVALIFGVFIMVVTWGVWSVGHFAVDQASGAMNGLTSTSSPYYEKEKVSTARYCYRILDEKGEPDASAPCYDTEAEAKQNPPKWFQEEQKQKEAEQAALDAQKPEGIVGYLVFFSWLKALVALGAGFLSFAILYPFLMRNRDAQNLMHDTTDINQYQGDQHVAIPDEVVRKFDWFPDVGAHSTVQPSSMISHVMLSNKGLKKIQVSDIAEKNMVDKDGKEYLRGEIICNEDGSIRTSTVSMIDEKFGDDLFEASGMPDDKNLRRRFVASSIEYNADGKNRDKLGTYKTVADLINDDWSFPEYEVQRPAGAYIVDTAPVNTMVLAITRAGKGQTYIEPMLDMWLREKRPNNMVVNDPKGELLVKHYVRATMRGFQVVQFNLINSMKTDIYNPLGMAAEAAREGDATKCALYIENIADVFFPLDGGEDPVWPSAANNAFKRAAYGLIDFYLEEERELRAYAARVDMDPKVLETKLDEKWGKVTLYNCYQLFVQLTAKKAKNPVKTLEERAKNGEFGDPQGDDFDDDAYEAERTAAQRKAFLWEDKPELDMLTLFFNATNAMPQNSMRTLVGNADNALRAMGAAEKMLASVYGIAITAMSFFTDPTISTLTSGTPSQNTDLGGLSFPRRMGVRFGMNFLKKNNLIGSQAKWEAFEDNTFQTPLGKDFYHEDIVSREGWARYYFKGKFAQETAFLRLRLVNPQTGMLIRTFFFKFTKDYQTNLTGRFFITDPISGEKIVKNGLLIELKPTPAAEGEAVSYVPGHTTYKQMRLTNVTMAQPDKEMTETNAIIQTMVRYSEQPKAVFLVTPPHLMKYAKLVLILVKQLVDLNFDKSYMTKENQKPLYKTRFMLDELGNLQSEGHGISGFETMLSIGLGQEQQFSLILQTLQQLRDVYGESVDKIVQGNTSNIVFLKSTDDSMIETLEKMSGKRHVVYRDSKTVTKDMERVIKIGNVEGKVSYTMNTKEEPVISYNDMAFISERQSVVFRAGDSPVWNRNETILPMSWRLYQHDIVDPGKDYSLQTIPTLSSALEFDVRRNQPDFEKMLAKRMRQAELSADSKQLYRSAFDYEEVDIARLDPDVYSDEVMELVDAAMRENIAEEQGLEGPDEMDLEAMEGAIDLGFNLEEDQEMKRRIAEEKAKMDRFETKIFASKQISRSMLVNPNGGALIKSLDAEIIEAYKACRPDMERDADHFSVSGDGALRSRDGQIVYISRQDETEAMARLKEASEDENERVWSEDQIQDLTGYQVHPEFYEFLAGLDSWVDLARGEFDRAMSRAMRSVRVGDATT